MKINKVKCDYCGKIFFRKTYKIKERNYCCTKCYHEAQRLKNEIIIIDEKTAKIILKNNKFTLIDIDDIEKCKNIYWYMNNRGYVIAVIGKPRKQITLHSFVTNRPQNYVVDHINRIKHDNRKENLRICRQIDNCQNKANRVNNISGVSFEPRSKKWYSYIGFKGKKIPLGRYINYEDAVNARKNAEITLYGGLLCS